MNLEQIIRQMLVDRGIHGFSVNQATHEVVKKVEQLCDEIVARKDQERLERCWAYEHMLPID